MGRNIRRVLHPWRDELMFESYISFAEVRLPWYGTYSSCLHGDSSTNASCIWQDLRFTQS